MWHSPPQTWIEPGSEVETADYIIFTDGHGNYYAKSGWNGSLMFSSTDAATVIQSAINSLTSGGKVFIKAGTYELNGKTITVTQPLVIAGEGSQTVLQSGTIQVSYGGAWNYRFFIYDIRLRGTQKLLILDQTIQSVIERVFFDRPSFVADTPVLHLHDSVSVKVMHCMFENYQMQSILIDGPGTYGIPTHIIAENDFGTAGGTLPTYTQIATIFINDASQTGNIIAFNTFYLRAESVFIYSVANRQIIIGNTGGCLGQNAYVIDLLGGRNVITGNHIFALNTAKGSIRLRYASGAEYNVISNNYIEGAGIEVHCNLNEIGANVIYVSTNGLVTDGVYQNIYGNIFQAGTSGLTGIQDTGDYNQVVGNVFRDWATPISYTGTHEYIANNYGYNPQPTTTVSLVASATTTIGPYVYPVQVILSSPSNAIGVSITRAGTNTALPIQSSYYLAPGDTLSVTEGTTAQTAYVTPQ
jgi:hypothetical protein